MANVTYGSAGWVRINERGIDVYVRLDGEGRVMQMLIDGGGQEITAPFLRRLKLAQRRAEALSRPDLLEAMQDAPDPGVLQVVRSAFPDEPVRTRRRRSAPFRLGLPGSGGLTPEFLTDVARAYNDAVAAGRSPNIALAEQSG